MNVYKFQEFKSWAFIHNTKRRNIKLAIFLHGFWGNYLTTWGKLPQMLHDHAATAKPFRDWDYLFLGYDTKKVKLYSEIAVIARSKWEQARDGAPPFDHRYTKLALFAHSLGTLGVRQLLCAWKQPKTIEQTIKSVTLLGSPLNGSSLAKMLNIIERGLIWPIASALRPDSPQLQMLREWVEDSYVKHPWPQSTVVVGHNDRVVGNELEKWAGDSEPFMVGLDHSSICKPEAWNDSEVMGFIKRGLK